MSTVRKKRIWLKILVFVFGMLIVLMTVFHFWFRAHARKMLEDMVSSRSNGKLKLKLENLHFNYFSKKMRLENAVFYTDSSDNSAYQFKIDQINLRAKAILPIIFRNEFMIDSIRLISPEITVTRLKPNPRPHSRKTEDVSIPEEMGKVYRSIQDAMSLLKIQRFDIQDGSFILVNKITPSQLPLKITRIQFQIDNFQVDENQTGTEKIFFSDNVILNSRNQDIIFPDGRHRLSFANFNINLKKKLVEFDSCTIAATRTDSSAASFNVFFDALQLTNIDFDTLYKAEVIKADSVFCLNPAFNLEVELKKKGIAPPKLENIIEQLTGDLLLDHVVVSNASFNIRTIRDGAPTSFAFSNNNFEMQGLRVAQQAVKPVTVRSFSMAIRNYENFIKDSLYSVSFDSVVFRDDKITLSHFLFKKLDKGRILNTFSIPQFNLTGLSWDDLVFENKLKADQAIMFNPYIDYNASRTMIQRGGKNIFQSLGVLNEYMDLQQLDIINGTIDLKLRNNLRVQLDDATLSVKSHTLLESKKLASIKNSLLFLRFSKGTIHAGNLDLQIHDIDYAGSNGAFKAKNIEVSHKGKTTLLEDIYVRRLVVDELNGNVFAEGVTWNKANIRTDAFGGGESESSVLLRSVRGRNTTIRGPLKGNNFSANIDEVGFDELNKVPGKKLVLIGLDIRGYDLDFHNKSTRLQVETFDLKDNNSSVLSNVNFSGTNASVRIPSINLIPQVKSLLDGKLVLDEVSAKKPVIHIRVPLRDSGQAAALLPVNIKSLNLIQPNLHYSIEKDSGTVHIDWNGEKNPSAAAQLKNLTVDGNITQVDRLKFYLTDFSYSDGKGKTFSTGDGKIAATLENIEVESIPNSQDEWQATIKEFDAKDFILDSLGKNKASLDLKSAFLENLSISSSLLLNMQKLVAANSNFDIRGLTGNFNDMQNQWKWRNLSFNKKTNTLHIDSFSIHPVLSRDSFMARQVYESDYMQFDFGELSAGPVDLEKYIQEKSLHIRKIQLDRFRFSDYRDKRLPEIAGTIKQLPVNLARAVPFKFSVDTLELSNASVDYTEMSEKTGKEGHVPVKRLNAVIIGFKNDALKPTDSLYVDATAYLLDTAWIRLRMKESYHDSLGTFLMALDMKPLDARVFNQILVPLEGVEIISGYADTLSMQAIAKEYMAVGEMKLVYSDLKIRLLPPPGQKNNFWLKLKNFIANSFVIRDKNKEKNTLVFFIRDRSRSAMSYILKIGVNGITNSISGVRDKKLIRKYKKELESKKLSLPDFKAPTAEKLY